MLCDKYWEEVRAGGELQEAAQNEAQVSEASERELGVALWHTCLEDLHRECMVGRLDATGWTRHRDRRDNFHSWLVKTLKDRRDVNLDTRHEYARRGLVVDDREAESVELAAVLPQRPAHWYDPDAQYGYNYRKLAGKVGQASRSAAVEKLVSERNMDQANDPPNAPPEDDTEGGYLDVEVAVEEPSRNTVDRSVSGSVLVAHHSVQPTNTTQPTADNLTRDTMTCPGVNLTYIVDKIKKSYEHSHLETPAEVLEIDTELRRLEWDQRLKYCEEFENNTARIRYEEDGIVPHRERYVDALQKFGVMYGTTRAFAVDKELMFWDHKMVNLIEGTLCQVCCSQYLSKEAAPNLCVATVIVRSRICI